MCKAGKAGRWQAQHVEAMQRRSSRGHAKAQQLMDHHLVDIEGRVRLTEGQGDRHTFLAVLESFS